LVLAAVSAVAAQLRCVDAAREAARLTRLGAELIATHEDRGPLTYVMRDPEGNEFCLH